MRLASGAQTPEQRTEADLRGDGGRGGAFALLSHLQLSSTWAFPGPLDNRVQIADSQIPFKILLNSLTDGFAHCMHLTICHPWPLVILYMSPGGSKCSRPEHPFTTGKRNLGPPPSDIRRSTTLLPGGETEAWGKERLASSSVHFGGTASQAQAEVLLLE